ncbi:hypothetical protein COCSADRAFT_172107 [Bipolaris sorokiniana ND90Pr]|uniref:F-box domain-containing protein n=1 Tax=Cochliobolus sativus (strain ND90Pr / ATCC 201652) TaxID=665912 RepID=M2S938_COCSN|nr:uncharacterized protein COCSADRAFT_172107 [Bipolaris sorokiniana ND90Pr]EMD63863.1 hypothetical protein COCSADRAFT_172107 [Bipolaris sorokiniana ND90Pr]
MLSCRVQLDHGKHDCTYSPTATLGILYTFPIELQQRIVSHLDVKSLLVFRRVSKPAMSLVNSLLEYKKIMIHAPMALRMAIAIKTHHRFTISDLFAALCQRHCEDCGILAHYICLFTCRRICLSQEKYCEGSLAPCVTIPSSGGDYIITCGLFEYNSMIFRIPNNAPRFSPVPGFHMNARIAGKVDHFNKIDINSRDSYVDMNYVVPGLKKYLPESLRVVTEEKMVMMKSVSAVVAPWMSKRSLDAEYGMQCQTCMAEQKRYIARFRSNSNSSMRILQCAVWTKEELEKHMREEHGVVEKSVQGDLTESV